MALRKPLSLFILSTITSYSNAQVTIPSGDWVEDVGGAFNHSDDPEFWDKKPEITPPDESAYAPNATTPNDWSTGLTYPRQERSLGTPSRPQQQTQTKSTITPQAQTQNRNVTPQSTERWNPFKNWSWNWFKPKKTTPPTTTATQNVLPPPQVEAQTKTAQNVNTHKTENNSKPEDKYRWNLFQNWSWNWFQRGPSNTTKPSTTPTPSANERWQKIWGKTQFSAGIQAGRFNTTDNKVNMSIGNVSVLGESYYLAAQPFIDAAESNYTLEGSSNVTSLNAKMRYYFSDMPAQGTAKGFSLDLNLRADIGNTYATQGYSYTQHGDFTEPYTFNLKATKQTGNQYLASMGANYTFPFGTSIGAYVGQSRISATSTLESNLTPIGVNAHYYKQDTQASTQNNTLNGTTWGISLSQSIGTHLSLVGEYQHMNAGTQKNCIDPSYNFSSGGSDFSVASATICGTTTYAGNTGSLGLRVSF